MALLLVENCPAAHAAQVRSAVALPAVDTRWPALQVVHAVQLTALLVVENCPGAHAAHVRSALALPAADTDCPALQVVHAVQVTALLVVENCLDGARFLACSPPSALPAAVTNLPGVARRPRRTAAPALLMAENSPAPQANAVAVGGRGPGRRYRLSGVARRPRRAASGVAGGRELPRGARGARTADGRAARDRNVLPRTATIEARATGRAGIHRVTAGRAGEQERRLRGAA